MYEVFQIAWWEQELFSARQRSEHLPPSILGWFLPWLQIVSSNTCTYQYSALQILYLPGLTSQSPLRKTPGLQVGAPPSSTAWKLSSGRKLVQSYCSFGSHLPEITVLCCLMSNIIKTNVFVVLPCF